MISYTQIWVSGYPDLGIWLSLRDLRPTTPNSFWRGRIFFLDPIFDTQKRLSKIILIPPFWSQNAPQNDQKIDKMSKKNSISRSSSVLHRCLSDFSSQTGAPEPINSLKSIGFYYMAVKTRFFDMMQFSDRFWSQIWLFGIAFWCKMDPKIDPESDLKTILFSNTFFWWILAYFWHPKGRLFHSVDPLVAPFSFLVRPCPF